MRQSAMQYVPEQVFAQPVGRPHTGWYIAGHIVFEKYCLQYG
jgi:hypothetical protein